MQHARNVAIVLALAAALWLVPGAGRASEVFSWLLSVAFLAALVLFAGRMYREHRVTIHGLGDRWRGILYAAIGVAVITVIATDRLWETPVGVLAWFALAGAAVFAAIAVFRASREY